MTRIEPFTFKYNAPTFEHKKEETYVDPLMKWPVRALAYTNDLGVVVTPLAPKLGMIMWFPAMMYFGADIYDKYKNDKTQYSPNGYRSLKQAIFQAIAGIGLPTTAVICGQKVTGAVFKNKLSAAMLKKVKVLGGLATLGVAVNPIDHFVEEHIIKKLVEPQLLRLDNKQVTQYKDKVLHA